MSYEKEYSLVEVGHGFYNKKRERDFSRGNYIKYNQIDTYVKKCNHFSVFSSAYRYTVPEVNKSALYGDLYLDFDHHESFEYVRKDVITALSFLKIVYQIQAKDVSIYFSGSKGVHLTVPAEIFGIEPTLLLNGIFKHIASCIRAYTPHKTIDLKIYDNRRLFRVPNTIHEKTGMYKVPITVGELKEFPASAIYTIASFPRNLPAKPFPIFNSVAGRQFEKDSRDFCVLEQKKRKDKRASRTLTTIPPCIQYILSNGAEKGSRNMTIACLSSFYRNYGVSLNETINLISDWNKNNSDPTNEHELKKTVESIFNGDKSYGCSTLKDLSCCMESECNLVKKGV